MCVMLTWLSFCRKLLVTEQTVISHSLMFVGSGEKRGVMSDLAKPSSDSDLANYAFVLRVSIDL